MRVCNGGEEAAANAKLLMSEITMGGHAVLLIVTKTMAPRSRVLLSCWQTDAGNSTMQDYSDQE